MFKFTCTGDKMDLLILLFIDKQGEKNDSGSSIAKNNTHAMVLLAKYF